MDLHAFGCPIYVLKKTLADGMSIPRWDTCASQGMYVGRSTKHANSVPLVLNLETGYMTPQWNVVFDDWFTAVTTSVDDLPDFHADKWSKMFGTETHCIDDDEDDKPDFGPVSKM